MTRFLVPLIFVCLCDTNGASPAKDAHAMASLRKSVGALGVTIPPGQGVSIQAMVSYTAGSDEETFQGTFAASGWDDTQITFQRTAGTSTETSHKGAGSWTDLDGKTHEAAVHNTWTSAAWFFPALLVQSWIADPELTISDLGQEERNGVAVEHLRCFRTPAGEEDATTAALVAQASQMELYVDPGT